MIVKCSLDGTTLHLRIGILATQDRILDFDQTFSELLIKHGKNVKSSKSRYKIGACWKAWIHLAYPCAHDENMKYDST